jgi:hypothetical protein
MEKGTYGISKILDIMEDCQAEPKSGKLNWPVSEQINVSIAKRAKFMGPGKFLMTELISDFILLSRIKFHNYDRLIIFLIFLLTSGLGGHNIKRLMAETGVQVTPHPDDVGTWTIFAPNRYLH